MDGRRMTEGPFCERDCMLRWGALYREGLMSQPLAKIVYSSRIEDCCPDEVDDGNGQTLDQKMRRVHAQDGGGCSGDCPGECWQADRERRRIGQSHETRLDPGPPWRRQGWGGAYLY